MNWHNESGQYVARGHVGQYIIHYISQEEAYGMVLNIPTERLILLGIRSTVDGAKSFLECHNNQILAVGHFDTPMDTRHARVGDEMVNVISQRRYFTGEF